MRPLFLSGTWLRQEHPCAQVARGSRGGGPIPTGGGGAGGCDRRRQSSARGRGAFREVEREVLERLIADPATRCLHGGGFRCGRQSWPDERSRNNGLLRRSAEQIAGAFTLRSRSGPCGGCPTASWSASCPRHRRARTCYAQAGGCSTAALSDDEVAENILSKIKMKMKNEKSAPAAFRTSSQGNPFWLVRSADSDPCGRKIFNFSFSIFNYE